MIQGFIIWDWGISNTCMPKGFTFGTLWVVVQRARKAKLTEIFELDCSKTNGIRKYL